MRIITASGSVYSVIERSPTGAAVVEIDGYRHYLVPVRKTRHGLAEAAVGTFLGKEFRNGKPTLVLGDGFGFQSTGLPRKGDRLMVVRAADRYVRRFTTAVKEIAA